MKRLVLLILVALLALSLVFGCGPNHEERAVTSTARIATSDALKDSYYLTKTAEPSRTPVPTVQRRTATLWCEDCAAIGMKINLWNLPQRTQVVGSLPHNTRVIVLEQETHDGRTLYQVSGSGQTGWVTAESTPL